MKRDRPGDLAQLVADFVCSDARPAGDTLERVKLVFADTVSATVAGATSDVVAPLRSYVSSSPSASADKLVLGTDLKASAEQAALLNGTMAAALEFDDVLSLMPAHPSAVVLAVLMATDVALEAPGYPNVCQTIMILMMANPSGSSKHHSSPCSPCLRLHPSIIPNLLTTHIVAKKFLLSPHCHRSIAKMSRAIGEHQMAFPESRRLCCPTLSRV